MQGKFEYQAVLCVSGNIADLYTYTFIRPIKHLLICSSSFAIATICRFNFTGGGYGVYFLGQEKIYLWDVNLPRDTVIHCAANVANTRIIINFAYDDII